MFGGYQAKKPDTVAMSTPQPVKEQDLDLKFGGKFFILQKSVYLEQNEKLNSIMSIDVQVNNDFSLMCVFKHTSPGQFWLYNKKFNEENNRLDSEE